MCYVHPIIIGKSNLPAPRLPSPQQLDWSELEFSMPACSVTARAFGEKKDTHTHTHTNSNRAQCCVCGDFPPKCPTDPLLARLILANGSFAGGGS